MSSCTCADVEQGADNAKENPAQGKTFTTSIGTFKIAVKSDAFKSTAEVRIPGSNGPKCYGNQVQTRRQLPSGRLYSYCDRLSWGLAYIWHAHMRDFTNCAEGLTALA